MRKSSINSYNEIEDELIQRAFDVDEDMPLPEDYILDEINDQSVEFLKRVEQERRNLELNYAKNNNKDIEYSLNVDNNSKFTENYKFLKISEGWIKNIKNEFEYLQETIRSVQENNKDSKQNLNLQEILNKYKLNSFKDLHLPSDIVLEDLTPSLTNKICIKLITHLKKLLFTNADKQVFTDNTDNSNNSIYHCNLWIYYILASLKTPLVDDDNSVLYSLNKEISKILHCHQNFNENENISLKVNHVIISEIFYQKVVYRSELSNSLNNKL